DVGGDFAVDICGIALPDGCSFEKGVGTVFFVFWFFWVLWEKNLPQICFFILGKIFFGVCWGKIWYNCWVCCRERLG
ncbi:hypothetical protein ACQWFT_26620, partial [Salmonella enterica subsp. enterica serovar Infantis]